MLGIQNYSSMENLPFPQIRFTDWLAHGCLPRSRRHDYSWNKQSWVPPSRVREAKFLGWGSASVRQLLKRDTSLVEGWERGKSPYILRQENSVLSLLFSVIHASKKVFRGSTFSCMQLTCCQARPRLRLPRERWHWVLVSLAQRAVFVRGWAAVAHSLGESGC